MLAVSVCFLVLLSGMTLTGPYLSPYLYDQQDPHALLSPPTRQHWMGTDKLGRDLLTRLMKGGRLSILIGVTTASSALLIGTIFGGISGYFGKRVDQVMMRIVDVVFALPDLLLIILMMLLFGRGFLGIFFALSIVSWVTVARLVRGEVQRIKGEAYFDAAQALGGSHYRLLFRHMIPNILGPLMVTLTYRVPAAILAESSLSFIGLGLAPPSASWGIMANDGWSSMRFYPHLILFPSMAIFLTILSLNTVGDWLRDYLDPRNSRR
ncbi:MAG: ABC transporter permease [Nitrospirae bacterium]|nr:ABC transporter permease [Nitrospirota bacterium]MBI3594653.1 ABC transporter permease [Nitrospirota bacterium]